MTVLAIVSAFGCSSSDTGSGTPVNTPAAPSPGIGDAVDDAGAGAHDASSGLDSAGLRRNAPVINGAGTSGAADAGLCGPVLAWPTACQDFIDALCCDEQLQCAGDAACRRLVDCINSCESPRTEACVAQCGTPEGKTATFFGAVKTCIKQTPPTDGGACTWP